MRKESILLLAVILIAVFPAQICLGVVPKYEIIDLGTLGGDYSLADAINEFGQVAGQSVTADFQSHAFLWDPINGTIDLGALPGEDYSDAYAINDCGQVVGFSGPDVGSAFIWDIVNGMRYLDGIGNRYGSACGINNAGQVIGDVFDCPGFGFLWEDSFITNLGFSPWAINHVGQVVGDIVVDDIWHVVLWDEDHGIRDLGTHMGDDSQGRAINDSGQVVGFSEDTLGNIHAFLWDATSGMVSLGIGYPRAINVPGQVVGSLIENGPAFYWDSETGMMRLDELIQSSSGWKRLNFGFDINNRGQIVGIGITNSGKYHAFLMTPVLPTIKVPMKFTPQTVNCYSKGKWVKANLVLPAEFTVEDVNSNSLTMVHPLGIEPNYTNIFVNENGLVEIDAGFDRAYLCSVLRNSLFSEETITIRGASANGQYFYGMDAIKIINNNFERLGLLSSQWLRADCSEPDWCEGADIDQDSEVNFTDFALLAFHWLEDHH